MSARGVTWRDIMTSVRRSHPAFTIEAIHFYSVELQEIDESAGPGYLKLDE